MMRRNLFSMLWHLCFAMELVYSGERQIVGFKVVTAGSRAEFNCETVTNKAIKWNHYAVEWKTVTRISSGSSVNSELMATHEVTANRSMGLCSLVIHSVTVNDAGQYECLESLMQISRVFELVVLASEPVCKTHMSLTGSETHVQCQVDFSGNWNLSIECVSHIPGIVNVTGVPFRSVEYSKRFFNYDSFEPIHCGIFSEMFDTGRESVPNKTTTYSYNWTIPFHRRSTASSDETSIGDTRQNMQVSTGAPKIIMLSAPSMQPQSTSPSTITGEGRSIRLQNNDLVLISALALGFFTVSAFCMTIIIVVRKQRRTAETAPTRPHGPAVVNPVTGTPTSRRTKSSSVILINTSTVENVEPLPPIQPMTNDTNISLNHSHPDMNREKSDSEDKEGSYESLDEMQIVPTTVVPVVYQGLSPRC